MKAMKFILATSVFAVVATSAVASDDFFFPSGVRAEVGTTGYGGAIQWTVNPYVGLAFGYNGGDISWDDDLKINNSKYDQDMNNDMFYLNTEIRPWGASDNKWAEAFYVAAGVAYLNTTYDLDRHIDAGNTFSVNNTDFVAGVDGVHMEGRLNYKKSLAPYVGLGYSPKFGEHWGAFVEGGAYYIPDPRVRLTATGSATAVDNNGSFQDAVRQEGRDIADKSKNEWMPVAKVGVNFFW